MSLIPCARVLVAAGLALSAPILAAAPSGLTHHWNFDEGPDWHDSAFQSVYAGTTANDSQGTSPATLQNMGAANWVSGRQFTGLEFNGTTQYLSVAGGLAAELGTSASLSFWLRTSQAGTASASTAPGVTGVAGAGGVQWAWLDDSGRIGLSLDNTLVTRSAAAVNDGNWHHLVLTRDASTGLVQVYVDGTLSASAIGPAGTRSNAFASLGRVEGAGYFAGRLDQVTVFNRVITAGEVTTQKNNHAPKSWNLSSDGVNDRAFTTPSVFSRAYDAERDPLTVKSWTSPAHGAVTHNGDGSFTFTPVAGYVGTDSFSVVIEDGQGGYHRSSITLRIITEPVGGTHLPVTQFTNFATLQAAGVDISHTGMRVPRAVDWNGDGLKDLLIGAGGYVWRYVNTGTAPAPSFAAGVKVQAAGTDIYAGTTSNNPIALADMTGDGVPDLVMADSASKLRVYRNTAAAGATPVYAASVFVKQSNGTTDFVLPDKRFDIGDYNADGKPDLITGTYSGNVQIYLNVNTAASPRFQTSTVLFGESYNAYPRFCDLGMNGQTDLVRGINWGDVKYWLDVPGKGLSGTQYLAITDSTGATPAFQSLTDGVIADFADFNGDGKTDMLIGGHASSKVYIAYGVGKTAAQSIADIEAIYDANLANLGTALAANSDALLGQVNTANLNLVNHLKNGSLGTREAVFAALAAHINKYAFLKYQQLDTAVYHHVPSIVLQNWVILGYLLPDTPARRVIVADTMGLTGTARQIYLEAGLALGDNGKSVAAAYGTIRDMMRRHPREAFPDSIITFDQIYGDARGGFIWTPNSTKNTFGQQNLGNANEWASDLTSAIEAVLGSGSASGDYFTFVMGHEVTHSLDNYVNTRANADLRRRWGARMVYAGGPDVRAGADSWYSDSATQANFQTLGYYTPASQTWALAWDAYWATGPGAAFNSLASMRIDIKFFFGSPQESLATQANHHFANGPGRLIGALDRFRRAESQGITPMKGNLSEVVDFIDFISSGMNRVNLVETKNQGGVVVWFDHYADLVRDDKGRITRITVDGRLYDLTLDANGLVTQVLTEADYLPRSVSFSLASTTKSEADGTATVTVSLDRPARYTPVTVNFADAATGTATAGSDYSLTPGTLTFNDGEQTKTITVNLLTDAVLEAPEAAVLQLSNPVGATLGAISTHSVVIVDASAPVVAGQQFSAASTMSAGTVLGAVAATPAPGRTIVAWSIVAGNTGATFGINAAGQVTLLQPSSLGSTPSVRTLTVRATDSGGASADGTVNIACNPPTVSGVWERRWSGATAYNTQTWTGTTNYSGSLATYTTAQNVADSYSRRLTGYLQPAVSGDYTFWIASDDASRLFLGTNATEASKIQIATVAGYTGFQAWDSATSQKSAVIPLVAGQIYWLEVQHQEGSGGDHASVAWSAPGISRQAIPSSVIYPVFGPAPAPSVVSLTSPADGSVTNYGAPVTLQASAVAGGAALVSVDFYDGATLLASDTTAPYGFTWSNAPVGSRVITARAVSTDGTSVSQAVTVTVNQAAQSISFNTLASKTFGDAPFPLTGSASSGLALTYASSNPAVATVSGSTVTIVGAGTATITASQPGNASYAAATSVPQTLTVAQASQTITFGALSPKTYGDAAFALAGSSTSGLALTYTSSDPAVATVSGSTVTLVAAGTTTITAFQAGNTNYAAAPGVPQTLTVNPPAFSTLYFDLNGATAGSGTPAAATWDTGSNWSTDSAGLTATQSWLNVPNVVFSAGTEAAGTWTVTVAGTVATNSLTFNGAANTLHTLSGGTINSGSGGLTLTASAAGLATGRSKTIASALTGTGGLTIAANGDTSDTGGSSNTVFTLSGANTFTGGVSITSGVVAAASTFGDAANVVTLNGGGLVGTVTGTLTRNLVAGPSGGVLRTYGAATLTHTGSLSGSGTLRRTDGGTFVAAGANTFSGILNNQAGTYAVTGTNSGAATYNINAGTLTIGNNGATGSLGGSSTVNIVNSGILRISRSDSALFSSLSPAPSFSTASSKLEVALPTQAAALSLDTDIGSNSTLGYVRFSGGTTTLASGTDLVSDTFAVGLQSGTNVGILNIGPGSTVTSRFFNLGDAASNSGIVNQTGGTVTALSGGNGFRLGHWNHNTNPSSQYNLTGGTLDATALSANATGSAKLVNIGWDGLGTMVVGGGSGSATLKSYGIQLDANGDSATYANTLTVSANGVVEVGAGHLASASANDKLILNGGTLRATATNTLAAATTVNASTSSVLDVGATFTSTFSGVVSGSGALTKSGSGIQLLSGTNTFTGGVTVTDGTLRASNPSGLGTGAVTVTGGVFDLNGQTFSLASTVGPAGTLSGAGGLGATTLNGILAPGGSASGLVTLASATVGSTANLQFQLAGTGTRGTNYDALTVNSVLALDGTVTVTLNGLTPALGQSFDLINSTGAINVAAFNVATDLVLPALAPTLAWDTSAFASSGVISIVVGGPSFTSFASANFSPAEQADPLISGPAADPDKDGVTNVMEYAFAMSPSVPSVANLPRTVTVPVSADTFVGVTYTRLKGATDLVFTPEFSSVPESAGYTASSSLQISLVDNGNGTETVTLRDTTPVTPSAPRFVRLRVLQN